MKIFGSNYDRYEECSVCGQPAGSPCVSLYRKYRSAHPMISVHPGRPINRTYRPEYAK